MGDATEFGVFGERRRASTRREEWSNRALGRYSRRRIDRRSIANAPRRIREERLTTRVFPRFVSRLAQFHAGEGVGTGKDFTLYALRDGEVKFKVGANKKTFVTVIDAVDRRGREDGQPTRKDKRRETYAPRAVVRAGLEEGMVAPAVERVEDAR